MKTWYCVDQNVTLLTITCERDPAWFAMGNNDWFATPEEAYRYRRSCLACVVDGARERLVEAQARLDAFDRAVEFDARKPPPIRGRGAL